MGEPKGSAYLLGVFMTPLAVIEQEHAQPVAKSEGQNLQNQFLTAQAIRDSFDRILEAQKEGGRKPAEIFRNTLASLIKCEVPHVAHILGEFVDSTRVDLPPEKQKEGKKGPKQTKEDTDLTPHARNFRTMLQYAYGAVRWAGMQFEGLSNYQAFAKEAKQALEEAHVDWRGITEQQEAQKKAMLQQRRYLNIAAESEGVKGLDFAALMQMSDDDRKKVVSAAADIEAKDKAQKRLEKLKTRVESSWTGWIKEFGMDGALEIVDMLRQKAMEAIKHEAAPQQQ